MKPTRANARRMSNAFTKNEAEIYPDRKNRRTTRRQIGRRKIRLRFSLGGSTVFMEFSAARTSRGLFKRPEVEGQHLRDARSPWVSDDSLNDPPADEVVFDIKDDGLSRGDCAARLIEHHL